ncbi:MAG: 16S rRNA (guanine(966)-N(2))-methyltransferase RsmD [Gammaproteobacteria bacterium]
MQRKTEQVRIIGGKWRSRIINFPALPDLRPTPDRVRETLFNWLAPYIQGARCLDAFAGSGVLGFEALSRGAKEVVMVDKSPSVIASLEENMRILNTTGALCINSSFPLRNNELEPFDIIFLDPPYHQKLIELCCKKLIEDNYLKDGALIYIEAEKELKSLPISSNWEVLKSKQAGQVGYHLVRSSQNTPTVRK